MAHGPAAKFFPIVFDESILDSDLQRLPAAAKVALNRLRTQTQRDGGISLGRLKRCHGEARDGTDLGGCVKTYVEWPNGPWGIVFCAGEDPQRPFALYTLAYGRRHHPRDARALTVYRLAHHRLHSTPRVPPL